jgi:hypothetical protein
MRVSALPTHPNRMSKSLSFSGGWRRLAEISVTIEDLRGIRLVAPCSTFVFPV